jgi:sec-independent protein translocase protein TatB
MLNIGLGEIVLIACLLLVVVGPERLPKLLRMAGRQYAKLRAAANELQNAFMDEGDMLDASMGKPPEPRPGRSRYPARPGGPRDLEPPAPRAAAPGSPQVDREQAPQAVELAPEDDSADEPVERVETRRPAELASEPLSD